MRVTISFRSLLLAFVGPPPEGSGGQMLAFPMIYERRCLSVFKRIQSYSFIMNLWFAILFSGFQHENRERMNDISRPKAFESRLRLTRGLTDASNYLAGKRSC